MTTDPAATYWNERAARGVVYKGEEFYTITPVPFYERRRELLLSLMTPYVGSEQARVLCDYGCGDGWYLHFFATRYPHKQFLGFDISEAMIEKARFRCPTCELSTTLEPLAASSGVDLVYALAVLAHVGDDDLRNALSAWRRMLAPGGRALFFEQVATQRQEGPRYVRRTIQEYRQWARDAHFEVEKVVLLRFGAHQLFERYVAKAWYKYLARGATQDEKRLDANRSWAFRLLSNLGVRLSRNPVVLDPDSGWGNALFVLVPVT